MSVGVGLCWGMCRCVIVCGCVEAGGKCKVLVWHMCVNICRPVLGHVCMRRCVWVCESLVWQVLMHVCRSIWGENGDNGCYPLAHVLYICIYIYIHT